MDAVASASPRLRALPASGDPEPSPSPVDAPAEFFRRYSPYVARIVMRLHAVDQELEDLVHEVFVVAFRQADKLRDVEAARGWLATITVRTVRRRQRQRKLRRWIGLESEVPLQLADRGATPEDCMQLSEIYQLLDRIAVADALAWKLRHVAGEPLDEVARQCECSLATVKRRIARASAFLEVNCGG